MDWLDFHGCKLALFDDRQRLLVFLRDDDPAIESPAMWDLPGGGREGQESPQDCVLRELEEEFSLAFTPDRLTYTRCYPNEFRGRTAYFFAGAITTEEISAIVFGDEGQRWTMMAVADYLESPQAVPRHKRRVRDYLARGAGDRP